jgi:hypothetical protein
LVFVVIAASHSVTSRAGRLLDESLVLGLRDHRVTTRPAPCLFASGAANHPAAKPLTAPLMTPPMIACHTERFPQPRWHPDAPLRPAEAFARGDYGVRTYRGNRKRFASPDPGRGIARSAGSGCTLEARGLKDAREGGIARINPKPRTPPPFSPNWVSNDRPGLLNGESSSSGRRQTGSAAPALRRTWKRRRRVGPRAPVAIGSTRSDGVGKRGTAHPLWRPRRGHALLVRSRRRSKGVGRDDEPRGPGVDAKRERATAAGGSWRTHTRWRRRSTTAAGASAPPGQGLRNPTKSYPLGGRPETRNGPRRSEGRTPHCYREAGANRRFPPRKATTSAPSPWATRAPRASADRGAHLTRLRAAAPRTRSISLGAVGD